MSDAGHTRLLESAQHLQPGEEPPAFSAEESAFLRAYSESRARLVALQASGKLKGTATMGEQHAALDWASALLGKAERLGPRMVCLAVGADLVYACARLKWVCDCDIPREVVKGLGLLFRIYGITERTTINRQVALVFDSAQGKGTAMPPQDLPFTMPTTDYAVFQDIETTPT